MEKTKIDGIITSSFLASSGFVCCQNGLVYHQVNASYKEKYDHFISSGLYETLLEEGFPTHHEEVNLEAIRPEIAYKLIRPNMVPFIFCPYEWYFSQLKNVALTTLYIQKRPLDFGMSLKDCSAYNIQFVKGKPISIDTLSFEKYNESERILYLMQRRELN